MDLQKIINQENVTLVDVRESFETFFGVAEGATKIPLRTIKKRVNEFHKMSKPIVVYCRSGNRSAKAMNYLKAQGILQVYNGGSLTNIRKLLKIKQN